MWSQLTYRNTGKSEFAGRTTAGKSAGDAIRLRKSTGKQRSVLWQSTDEQWDAVRAALCDPKDHSAEFDGKDIADHKLFAMLPYLLGILGTIVALLVAKDSPYVGFHVREGIRILVSEVLLGLITVVFCWTVVVPIAAAVCFIILLVVRIISFVNVCNGKAKEAAIVSNFGFLK